MATAEEKPPDIIYFSCHNSEQKENKTIVCIICGSAYHRSCFDKTYGILYIKGALGICKKHTDIDITSKNIKTNDVNTLQIAKKCILEMH